VKRILSVSTDSTQAAKDTRGRHSTKYS